MNFRTIQNVMITFSVIYLFIVQFIAMTVILKNKFFKMHVFKKKYIGIDHSQFVSF